MSSGTTGTRVDREHLAFTLATHRALAPDPTSAACWSPFSVASALGLLATGARGTTRDELTALLLGDRDGSLADHAAMLSQATQLDQVGYGDPAQLGVSNTLWTRPRLPVTAEFIRELLTWPNGSIAEAPFDTDPTAARQLINNAVAETTRGLIRELVQPGDLTTHTLATLVNALYLKAGWRDPFPDRATAPQPFHAPGGQVDVPTMRLAKRLGYAAAGGWQAVVLPANGALDAVVLLPDGDLGPAEAGLDADALAGLLDAPKVRSVQLLLPKFRVSARSPLTQALAGLGVHAVFTDQADLSGISDVRLAVSGVLHQAVLTVDEQGFEGAAATAVVARAAMAMRPEEPVVVRVDRPFLLLVRHRASGAVYFLARVVSP